MAARKSRTAPLEAILDEIATLDAESAEVLGSMTVLLNVGEVDGLYTTLAGK